MKKKYHYIYISKRQISGQPVLSYLVKESKNKIKEKKKASIGLLTFFIRRKIKSTPPYKTILTRICFEVFELQAE